MKTLAIFTAACFSIFVWISPAIAADSTDLEKKVQQLEQQLEEANKTISDLQDQLAEAQKGSGQTPSTAAQTGAGTVAAGTQARPASDASAGNMLVQQVVEPARIEERNRETPGSVVSLSPEQLMLGGVEDLSRIELLVPSLRYGQTGQDVRLSMRGARTNSIGPQGEQAVSVYEDGIFAATTTELRNAYIDVERVDVLAGPQVTTFGQGAYAGAVNVVSHKPNFDGISGYAEAENGLPDKTRWRLALNIPASDTLAFRVAGVSESRSGWINNAYVESDSDDLNDRKVQAVRASVLWQPSDRFSVLFWSRYQDENGTGSAPWGYQQVGGYVDGELLPGNQFAAPGSSVDGGPWDVVRNYISAAEYENWVNTLDINWDLGFASLQWLANFTSFHGRQSYDNDYTNQGEVNSTPFAGWSTSQTGWSNELRLTSNSDGAFDWLAAFYAADRSADWGWLEAVNGELEQPSWDTVGDYKVSTVAAFGQASYAFTDRLRATAGVRWNQQDNTYKTGQKGSWDDVLWKAALEYQLSDRSMTYGSISTGYRPGGINTAPGVNPTWDSEKLTAYEIGYKTRFADDEVSLDLAAWYNDFKDVQSQSFLVMPYPGSPEATEYTGNGGVVDAKGIEAEVQWTPTPQWYVAAQLAYTNAKFGNYVAPNLAGLGDIPGHSQGDMLSFEGWHPALSPDWVVGLQTYYTFLLGNGGTLTPYLQTSYTNGFYASDYNLEGVRQGSNSRTDFRIVWLSPGESFQLQFYYLNAEDEAVLNWARVYNPAARPDITTLQGNWGNPNTYGIIFNYAF
jgi:outer membrane receptor protein involved in Fe transport